MISNEQEKKEIGMETTKAKAPSLSVWQRVRQSWQRNPLFGTAWVLLLMVLVQTAVMVANGHWQNLGDLAFLLLNNWVNLLRNNAPVGIIALGMTLAIVSAGIDLSVGSTLVAVGALVMTLIDGSAQGFLAHLGITGPAAYAIAIVVGLAFGLLLGLLNGALIAWGKIPAFIATLGTMEIFRSVTQHVMQKAMPTVPAGFVKIANTPLGPFYLLPILYWAILAVLLHLLASRTAFGRQVYAVGSNAKTARLSGISVQRVRAAVYAIVGFLVAAASIIQVARLGSMDFASAGSGYEMDAIAAVIVGGTRMSGGRGSMIGSVLGMLIIAVMNNLLTLFGVPPFLRAAFKGLIVIVAVLLQRKEG